MNLKNNIKQKLKRSFIINGLLQYFGNTSCHYQAKISKEKKTNIRNSNSLIKAEWLMCIYAYI
jgi:hypothetical protein